MVRLKEVATVQAGCGFPKRFQGQRGSDYGFYKVGDISRAWLSSSLYLLDPEHEISKETLKEIKGTLVPANSIVFAKIGEAIKLNRRALTKHDCLVDNNVFALIPNKTRIHAKFLFYYFLTVSFTENCRATTVPSLRKSDIEEVSVPDFNLDEQQRIIDAIETQFTRLDEAGKALKIVKEKLKMFRKSILKTAFNNGWQYEKLGNLFDTTSGGTPSRSNKSYYLGTIPWLKSGELNDERNINDSEEHITEQAIKNSSAKKFPFNSVLIALYGATTGKLGIIRNECATNQAVCGILPTDKYVPEFIFYYLLFRRSDLIKQGKGGAQPNISQGIVRDTMFPLADEKDQHKVLDFIESQFSVIQKLEDVIGNSLVKTGTLRKSILKSAFEGKLVN